MGSTHKITRTQYVVVTVSVASSKQLMFANKVTFDEEILNTTVTWRKLSIKIL